MQSRVTREDRILGNRFGNERCGLLRPQAVRWIFVISSIAAFPVGWAVSQIMLLTLFVIVISPVALLFKIAGRDRLGRKRMPERQTYWNSKTPTTDVRRYLRQY